MSERDRPRLLLVEHATLLRQGVRSLLEREGFEVVADHPTVQAAIDGSAEPDLVITDIWLRDGRGAGAITRLCQRFPSAPILVLTAIDDPLEVRAAFGAGARGYITTDADAEELSEAVRRVVAGFEYLHPSLGASLARLAPASSSGTSPGLSGREREVLRLIALGHTNAVIATFLGVSLRTVEAHRGRLYRKLGLKTRADLVRYVAQSGLSGER